MLNVDILDEIVKVTNAQAMEATRQLAVREGILAGISTGAALHAAMEVAARPESKGRTIVGVVQLMRLMRLIRGRDTDGW